MSELLNGIFECLDINSGTGLATEDNLQSMTSFQRLFYTQVHEKIGIDAVYFLRDANGIAKVPLIYFSVIQKYDAKQVAELHRLSWNLGEAPLLFVVTPDEILIVRAKPCLPLWSFSLIRKTELWKTNKPPAMQVSQHCFSLQKKTSGGIINVGSPTALIYTGGIHMDNNSLSHTKWNCKYHIVFAPKYRRKVAYGKIKQDIADILSMLCKRKGVKIVEAEICPDHVHMLVEIPPSISVSYFVGYLKGKSTLMIFERHANLKYKYGNRHFWCRGYYVDTVGKNAKKMQEYIANQLQDDLEYDQMTLKEYIDPFTGEPVKRNK